jgi:DNA-directed RNA polymerase subunit RPC12/RpoP
MTYRLGTWKCGCAYWHFVCHTCRLTWNVSATNNLQFTHAPECPRCGSKRTRTLSCLQAGDVCNVQRAVIGGRRANKRPTNSLP